MLIVANWKMHPQTLSRAKVLKAASKRALGTKKMELVLAPPAVFLRDLAKSGRSARISYAAQNAHFEKEGAYTGEVSMQQVKDSGATYVIVGHAERRGAGETNGDTQKKVAAAFAAGLSPILCVGETSRDEDGDYLEELTGQLLTATLDIPKNKIKDLVIAYEPVWAIGASEAMSPNAMHEMALYIRKTLLEPFGKAALSIPILYGGSIDESNAKNMLEEGEVQGLLVGRVSTDPIRFGVLLRSLRATTTK